MRMLSAAAVVVVLTVPAFAQMQTPSINLMPEVKTLSPEEKEQETVRDKAYKDSLRKIPDSKASSDPWGAVRSTEAPKAAAPAKKSKTGSSNQ